MTVYIGWYNENLVKVAVSKGYLSDCLLCLFNDIKCKTALNRVPCHVIINKSLGTSLYNDYFVVKYLTMPISLYASIYAKNLRK